MSQDRIRELEQECKELRARVQILEQIIKYQNSQGATGEAVAITADGKVYMGSYMGSVMPGRMNRFLERLVGRFNRASIFVLDHLRSRRKEQK